MKNLSNGLPIIIDEKTNFSCFMGFVKGTIELLVYDNGSDQFPSMATVNTNLGSGSISLTLSKNETIKKSISGIDINVTISDWKCTVQDLSFHVKAEAKKGLFSCTVFDRTLNGKRHNVALFEEQMTELLKKAEATHP